jgi:uncharacterized protein (DUF4415 family)
MKYYNSKQNSRTDWERLTTMPDTEIDISESPELGSSFFSNAILRLPKPKRPVSVRLDDDVVQWFKGQGKGYQTKISAVLRLYIQA